MRRLRFIANYDFDAPIEGKIRDPSLYKARFPLYGGCFSFYKSHFSFYTRHCSFSTPRSRFYGDAFSFYERPPSLSASKKEGRLRFIATCLAASGSVAMDRNRRLPLDAVIPPPDAGEPEFNALSGVPEPKSRDPARAHRPAAVWGICRPNESRG